MHLAEVQHDAFATAAAKGFHANLQPESPVTDREHALILLARLHQRLDVVTQLVKRHGITHAVGDAAGEVFHELRDGIYFLDWLRLEAQEGELARMTGCSHMSASAATLIRLALAHTELSEASECIADVNAPLDEATRWKIAEELADNVIRSAELCAYLLTNIDTATQEKLAANKRRPYAYGTPLEQKDAH